MSRPDAERLASHFPDWQGGEARAAIPHRAAVEHRDLHATLLHLFGLDPDHLTFRNAGLEEKLIGVGVPARVVSEVPGLKRRVRGLVPAVERGRTRVCQRVPPAATA